MRQRRRWLFAGGALLCASILALCLLRASAQPAEAAAPLKIAVVNIPRLFSGLSEWKDCQEKLREKNQEMERVNREMRKDIDALKEQVRALALGTEERAAKEDEVIRKQKEWETRMNSYSAQAARMTNTWLDEIYRRVIREIEQYAADRKLDLVLKVQDIDPVKDKTAVRIQIEMATVTYASGRADITEEMIQILNRQYGKGLEVK